MVIITAHNLIDGSLIIHNDSGKYVKIKFRKTMPGESTQGQSQVKKGASFFASIWIAPDDAFEFSLSYFSPFKNIEFIASFTEEIDQATIELINEPEHDISLEPKEKNDASEYFFSLIPELDSNEREEYARWLTKDIYLPELKITDDKSHKSPIINFPRDVKSLQAAIEKEARMHAEQIAKEVREAEPKFQIPGVPEIISGYAVGACK